MKQISFGFALISCVVIASLCMLSCSKKDGELNSESISKNSPAPVKETPPANPAIAYLFKPNPNSSNNLMVMNADGSNQTAILTGVGPSEWSPAKDSSLLLVERLGGLWLVDISVVNGKPTGSNLRQIPIVNSPAYHLNGERWSPLGDSIVFATEETKIYTISSAGGTPRLVYAPATGFAVFDPDWSPDGTKISFDEWNDAWTQSSLKVLDLATGIITTVVPPSAPLIYYPMWSHHGDRIAYQGAGVCTVFPTANSPIVNIAAGGFPAWSSDDSKLALVSGRSNGIFTYTFSSKVTQSLSSAGTFLDWKK